MLRKDGCAAKSLMRPGPATPSPGPRARRRVLMRDAAPRVVRLVRLMRLAASDAQRDKRRDTEPTPVIVRDTIDGSGARAYTHTHIHTHTHTHADAVLQAPCTVICFPCCEIV